MASWAELNKQAGSKQPQQASSWGSLNESAKASQPMRVSAPTPTQPVAAPVVAPKQTFKTVATDVATTFGQSLYNQGASAVESWKDAYNVFTNPRQEDTITKKWVDDYMGVQGKPESVKMVANVIGKEAKQAVSNTTSAFGAILKAGIKTMALAPTISVGNAGVEATAKIPYVGLPVKVAQQALGVLNEKIYNGVVSAVNAAPISDQAKKDLADPLAELATFIGSVAIMKKGGDLTGAVAQKGAKTFGASPATQAKVGTAVNVGIGYSVDPFMTAFELLRGNITSRAQARAQATGRALNAEDARRVVNEAVKETPVPDMPESTMEVATPGGKVNIVTNQKLVLQNLIKGREDLSYRVVDDLGTDPVTGTPINSRFDWDYKTQQGTITTTNKATAVDLAHELGYFVDRRIGSTLSKALSDIVPEYRDNRDQINQLLADYALDRLDGNATKADIDAEVLKIAQNITQEVGTISAIKQRQTTAQQFAGAFGDVINDPDVRSKSPELAQIIDYSLGKVARPSKAPDVEGIVGSPEETSSVMRNLEKTKKSAIKETIKSDERFAEEQIGRIDRLQALEEKGAAASANYPWDRVSKAIRESREFKKEGSITDATINGVIMELGDKVMLVPMADVRKMAQKGWVSKMTMDEIATANGFERAEDYTTFVNELYQETRAITRSSEQKQAHEYLMKNNPEYARLEETIAGLREQLTREAERVLSPREEAAGNADSTPVDQGGDVDSIKAAKQAGKSFDEWIKERGEMLYHGTSADFDVKDFKGGYLTKEKSYADIYQKPSASSITTQNKTGVGRTIEFFLPKNAKIFDFTNKQHREAIDGYWREASMSGEPSIGDSGQIDWTEGESLAEWIENNGLEFDGIKLDEGGGIDPSSGVEIKRSNSIRILNPSILKTRSELKTQWDSINTLQAPTEASSGVNIPNKQKSSRVFERLQEEFGEEMLEGRQEYNTINLREQSERAGDLIATDRQKAYRIAMGIEESPDITSTATNIALADAALEAGNNALFAQLTKARSLAQTRRGQEIVSEKTSVTDNSVSSYVKQLISMRMEKLGKSYLGDARQLVGVKEKTGEKVMESVKKDVEVAQKDVQKRIKSRMDISKAQKLIDSLSC